MASNRGAQIPSALIRPQPLEPEEATVEPIEGQGAAVATTEPQKSRRKRTAAADKSSKRGLYLSDALWERLQLEAIRRRKSVSMTASEYLERSLPRLRIEREG